MLTVSKENNANISFSFCNQLFLFFFAGNLREELMCAGIPDLAKQLSSHENEDVRNAAEMLINVLEEGPSVER